MVGGMARQTSFWLPVTLGVLFVIVNYAVGVAMELSGFPPNQLFAVGWVVILPAVVAWFVAKRLGAAVVTSNTSLERTREG